MNRPALVISLVAVFLVGIALGLMGGIVFSHRMQIGGRGPLAIGPGPHGMRSPGGHGPMADALPRLTRLLNLTPEQVRRIEPRVIESQRQFEAARDSLHSRIDAELTPEQRVRWREFQRKNPFPGPPPPGNDDRTHRAPPGDEGENR